MNLFQCLIIIVNYISGQTKRIVVALHDYQCTSKDDISFVKGDRLKLLNDSDDDWWQVQHTKKKSKGLIPKEFVVLEGSLECYDDKLITFSYFHGKVSRNEADKLLLNSNLGSGTFLVRYPDKYKSGYSLSIKTKGDDGRYNVKHYKIHCVNDQYYIAKNDLHPSLDEMITYYRDYHHGLCCRLKAPCPKQRPDLYDITPMYKKDWNIPREEIRLEKRLGQGNFGEVWYGKWREQTEIAVKTMKPNTMSKDEFKLEADTMKKLRHKKLVALYGVCIQGEDIWIITEYLNNGSLLQFLRADVINRPPFEDLVYISSQVASGMAYLEQNKLVHRDLAARNVLIGENNIAKIADFGLARAIIDDTYEMKNDTKFPIKWTAPEAIMYHKFTVKTDVWSFGILLYEIFTYGAVPYPGLNAEQLVEKVLSGYKMPKPRFYELPDPIYNEMVRCWDLDPARRPTFDFLANFFEFYGTNAEGSYGDV